MSLEEHLGGWMLRGLLCPLAIALTQSPFSPPTLLAGEAVQGKVIQGQVLQGPAIQGQTLQGPALQGPAIQGLKTGQVTAAPLVKVPVVTPPPSMLLNKSGAPSPPGQKSYPAVKMQQGRVLTDSDWNEQSAKPPSSALVPKAIVPPGRAQALKPKLPPKAFLPPQPQPPEPGHFKLDPESGAVVFGDGQHGKRPPGGKSAPAAEYRIGAGQEGALPPLPARVVNPPAIEGGSPPETTGEAERRVPGSLGGGSESPGTADKGKDWAKGTPTKAKGSQSDLTSPDALEFDVLSEIAKGAKIDRESAQESSKAARDVKHQATMQKMDKMEKKVEEMREEAWAQGKEDSAKEQLGKGKGYAKGIVGKGKKFQEGQEDKAKGLLGKAKGSAGKMQDKGKGLLGKGKQFDKKGKDWAEGVLGKGKKFQEGQEDKAKDLLGKAKGGSKDMLGKGKQFDKKGKDWAEGVLGKGKKFQEDQEDKAKDLLSKAKANAGKTQDKGKQISKKGKKWAKGKKSRAGEGDGSTEDSDPWDVLKKLPKEEPVGSAVTIPLVGEDERETKTYKKCREAGGSDFDCGSN